MWIYWSHWSFFVTWGRRKKNMTSPTQATLGSKLCFGHWSTRRSRYFCHHLGWWQTHQGFRSTLGNVVHGYEICSVLDGDWLKPHSPAMIKGSTVRPMAGNLTGIHGSLRIEFMNQRRLSIIAHNSHMCWYQQKLYEGTLSIVCSGNTTSAQAGMIAYQASIHGQKG